MSNHHASKGLNLKSVFITGANRGLGYAFVQYFLEQDFLVFGGTRVVSDSLPKHPNLIWVQCDVMDDESIRRAVATVSEKTDGLAFLINNAGTNKDTIPEGNKDLVSKLGRLDRGALLNMFNVNAVSPIMVTHDGELYPL